ncbi:MAG TPA: patatin-like phospholipase family protein, partial [Kiloniellaceae bacterium]|nr:patatin-like phospholipase family protein [Kiloniellaceae bacterium]
MRPRPAQVPAFGGKALPAIAILLVAASCGPLARFEAVPVEVEPRAAIPNMRDIRYWGDGDPAQLDAMAAAGNAALQREIAYLAASGHQGAPPPAHVLAISGGGENGAFGAGLLVGWTAAGTRPQFKIVTGISTGALTAPLAFLGPAYDDTLRAVYTTISAKDVFESRGVYGMLFQDAMADNAPLRATVAKYFDQAILDAIGEEDRKGRILLIG